MKLISATTITVTPAVVVTTDTIVINIVVDNQNKVDADFTVGDSSRRRITLWDNTTTPTYTEIGDWTQKDAEDRIAHLLGSAVKP